MIRLASWGLLLAIGAAALAPAQQADVATLKRQGGQLLNGEQPELVLELMAKAQAAAPKDPEIFIFRGEAQFQLERYEAAVESFNQALAIDRGVAVHLQNLGHALLKLHRIDQALAQFELIAKDGPNANAKARGMHGAGLVLAERGEDQAARQKYEAALALDPTLMRARYRLALCQLKAGEPGPAADNLRQVVARDPLYEGAAYNLSLALAASGDAAGAKEWQARFQQGKRIKRTIEDLKLSLRANPGSASSLLALARSYREGGSLADAVPWYGRYLAAQPGDAAARQELAEIQDRLRQADRSAAAPAGAQSRPAR